MIGDKLKPSEAEVAELVQNYIVSGETELWGRIFEKFKKNIFILCFRMLNNEEEAKDITSDIFIKAAEKIYTYELNRPFLPWLYGIAKNLCIDHIRRKQRIQFTQINFADNIRNDEDSVDEEDTHTIREKIQKSIDTLKRPQRTCFCLFYIQDKSYNEIVQLTGYSYDEVRSHIQNGRRKFKIIAGKLGLKR